MDADWPRVVVWRYGFPPAPVPVRVRAIVLNAAAARRRRSGEKIGASYRGKGFAAAADPFVTAALISFGGVLFFLWACLVPKYFAKSIR